MHIQELKTRSVGVVGVGHEGQAIISYLLKNGVRPSIFDNAEFIKWPEAVQALVEQNQLLSYAGENSLSFIDSVDLLFRSPGVRLSIPELVEFAAKGKIITSQTKWFFDNCPSKIVGITGTKGKGTTSSLIFEALKFAKSLSLLSGKPYLTGNIGQISPLDFLSELTSDDVVVFELSSFQLQDLTKSPDIAVVLMTTQDHMDYHESVQEYISAKSNITNFQSPENVLIYNQDYPNTSKLVSETKARQIRVSSQIGSVEYYVHGGIVTANGEDLDFSDRLLRGQHNMENIAAALAVLSELGVPSTVAINALKSFRGLEHRLELVGEVRGVRFINDSISTTADTTIAALKAFEGTPVSLILGGSEKNLDYTVLYNHLEKNPPKIICMYGPVADRMLNEIQTSGYSSSLNIKKCNSFYEAVNECVQEASSGEVVLLSPATASFDSFKNYKERGNRFKEIIKTLISQS